MSKVCPVCTEYLSPSHNHGIEIDYCPRCKGVWLDHGELEKVLTTAKQYNAQGWQGQTQAYGTPPGQGTTPNYGSTPGQGTTPNYGSTPSHGTPNYGTPGYGTPGYGTPNYGSHGSHSSYGSHGYGHGHDSHHYKKKKKHESFLEDLFDIF